MAVFTGEDSPSFTEQGLDLGVFGQRLRHARRAKGLTLAELGQRVGRAPSVLSLIENGRREPKLSLIEALAAALSVPTAELLRRQPPSRRAQLEIALEEAQQDPVYRELGLPHLRVGARVPSDVIEHLLALYGELRKQRAKPTATPEEAREANAGLRAMMRERGNYFAEIEQEAATALATAGYTGGALSQGMLLSVVSHHGFTVRYVRDLPRSARSVTDLRDRRIYLKQESIGMHTPRTILLQTLGHFVLGHSAPEDFADFLRQRVEANYFAAAVLVPEQQATMFLREAADARSLSVEDLRDVFSVSYEMAAHRFTNLATHHLGLPCHFVKNDEGGIIYKAVVRPAGVHRRRPVQPVLPVLGHAVGDVLVRGVRRPESRAWLCHHTGRPVRALSLVPRPGDDDPAHLGLPGRGVLPAPAGRTGGALGGPGLALGPGAFAHPVRAAHGQFSWRRRSRRL
jgi:predicted transcriptional regulator/DNA-binding XRE family transcriptional regulator